MKPLRLLVLLISLPLLLGGCGEKSIADVKADKKQKHDVLDEKFKNLSSEEINQLKKAIKILEGHDVTLDQIVTEWLERNKEKALKETVVDSTKIVKRKGVAYLVNSENPFSGKVQTFDDGVLREEVTYQDGKFILEEVYYPNGQKRLINELDGDGIRVESNSWFLNGQKRRERITDGAKKTIIGWHKNGQKRSEANFFYNKLNGLSITWNEDGEELSKVDYTNDVGLETALYENGIKKYELTYNQLEKQKLVTWWPNGKIASEVSFKDNKKHGLGITWHENGIKASEGNYDRGSEVGLHSTWYSNSQKKSEVILIPAEREQRKNVSWYFDGQKKSEEIYKGLNNKIQSKTRWHENGIKSSEVNYTYAVGKVGGLSYNTSIETVWFSNGQKKSEINFRDDEKHGMQLEWHENGNRKSASRFTRGRPGQHFFDLDGKEYSNLDLEWNEEGILVKQILYGRSPNETYYRKTAIFRRDSDESWKGKYYDKNGREVDSLEEATAR